jgi:tyrosine-protein kinase Etk/Wzc
MATETPIAELSERADSPLASRVAARSGEKDDEVSVLDLLIVLAQRKRFIFLITAVFTICAAIVSLILPPRYTATVTLLPPQQSSTMSGMLASQMGGLASMAALTGNSLGIKNPNDMYVAMFKSHTVEDGMVQRFDLMHEYHQHYLSDAIKAFESRVTVDGSGKDGLIRISVRDGDPRRAAELANGYIDQFRNLSQHLAITEASQRRLFFEQQLEQAKNKLADAEEALKKSEITTGVIQLDSQARALIESATTLRAQIDAKEVQIQGMETYATGENGEVVQAQRELEGMRAQLAKLGGQENGSSGELLMPRGRVPEAGLEYVRKLRDVKYNETIFDILARQFEVAKLDEAKQGALVQVVDPAITPEKRSFPIRSLIVGGAVAVGFFFAVCVVLLQAGFRCLKADAVTAPKLAILRRMLSFRRV